MLISVSLKLNCYTSVITVMPSYYSIMHWLSIFHQLLGPYNCILQSAVINKRHLLTDSRACITVVFFSSYKLPSTLFLLFGPVALRDIALYFDEWRICLVVRLWTPSDQHAPAPRFRLIHSHRSIRLTLRSDTTSGGAMTSHPSLHLRLSCRGCGEWH